MQPRTGPSTVQPHIRLVTERAVERFLLWLFLRDEPVHSLCLISPFIDPLRGCRFTLQDVSDKIRRDQIFTYVVTREPIEEYQRDAMKILSANEWIEIRYNESLHAKVFLAATRRESESFALFGSGNLTGRAVRVNLEVGMMLLAKGQGRPIIDELSHWAQTYVRVLPTSRLYKRIGASCYGTLPICSMRRTRGYGKCFLVGCSAPT
jgi:hypothetical protein